MSTSHASAIDVVVAGAGPAGATAARTLAAAGLRTLIVDRAAFPRNKPCGGGISVRALGRFPWLHEAIAGIDVHRVDRLHLAGPGGATLDVEGREPCVLLIRRVEFDAALVQAALAAGARLETRFEVTQVLTTESAVTLQARDGRRISAPYVVAADGVHSVIAKRTGANQRWPRTQLAIDMMEETPAAVLQASRPDVLWVAYAYNGLDGYAYVFPKTHHVNVGIGCLLSHYDKEVPDRPYALQEQFVDSLVEAGVLHGHSDRNRFTPFLIPVGGPLLPSWCGRVLFAGDAGGFVNAISAEGIYYAMVSGELAGRVIAADGAQGSPGMAYERAWRAEIGTELADAVLMQRYLFSSHSRVSRAIRGAAASPALVTMMLDYVCGKLSYPALRRRMLMRFPLTVFRMARERLALGGARAS